MAVAFARDSLKLDVLFGIWLHGLGFNFMAGAAHIVG